MLADVTGSAGRIRLSRSGSFGETPAEVATSLVLVLTELVQNALEHAFTDVEQGTVVIEAERSRLEMLLTVLDDGTGLPDGFTATGGDRLGLQIVQTLVSAELGGSVEFGPRPDGAHGAAATVLVPIARRVR
jgi:two-component sensor histidine kinase